MLHMHPVSQASWWPTDVALWCTLSVGASILARGSNERYFQGEDNDSWWFNYSHVSGLFVNGLMVGVSLGADMSPWNLCYLWVCVGYVLSGMQCSSSLRSMRSWLEYMLLSLLAIAVLIYMSIWWSWGLIAGMQLKVTNYDVFDFVICDFFIYFLEF